MIRDNDLAMRHTHEHELPSLHCRNVATLGPANDLFDATRQLSAFGVTRLDVAFDADIVPGVRGTRPNHSGPDIHSDIRQRAQSSCLLSLQRVLPIAWLQRMPKRPGGPFILALPGHIRARLHTGPGYVPMLQHTHIRASFGTSSMRSRACACSHTIV